MQVSALITALSAMLAEEGCLYAPPAEPEPEPAEEEEPSEEAEAAKAARLLRMAQNPSGISGMSLEVAIQHMCAPQRNDQHLFFNTMGRF